MAVNLRPAQAEVWCDETNLGTDELLEALGAAKQDMVITNRKLRQTRDLLLPKLVSGEVGVEGMEIKVGDG